MLVRDPVQDYPSYEAFLYSSLDFQMVVMYILWWFLFEHYTENSVLSIGCVYFFERCIRETRCWLGKRNLVKKTFMDARFMN